VYAKSLSIYGFRIFGKAELELQYPGRRKKGASPLPNVNLVLGDNGGGKSSVLRALAIAILAPVLLESGFVPYRLVRRPHGRDALLKVKAILDGGEQDAAPVKEHLMLARIDRRDRGSRDRLHLDSTPDNPILQRIFDDFSPAFFMVGYGATRRVETGDFSESSARRSRGLRYQRVAGLFEDHVSLRPLQAWMPKVKDGRRRQEIERVINQVLPPSVRFTGRLDEEEDQYLFDFEGIETPLNALSDGYKAFIGMAGDLLSHLNDVCPPDLPLTKQSGIVLVDEIDLHLHPSWQRTIVPTLAAAFPRIQFIMTSHSPLVVGTVHRENIFITDLDGDGVATIKQIEEKVFGRGAEQLLLSSYFGLTTTRAEAFVDEAQDLFRKAADGDADAALAYLERLTGNENAGSGTDGDAPARTRRGRRAT